MNIKKELMYTENHEWIRYEGEFAFIGITDYAQNSLGDIVFVELPETGDTFKEGDGFAVIESVKAVSDVYSPGSGTVDCANELLVDSPELLNSDCYGTYIVKFRDFEVDGLMTADEYEAFTAKEQ
ncbi:MAG: glycine cleavage system protein GcvH [Clostridiales bacterium]|nr:glycine cleavage system protein GcvH [Clostridiales bacterium]